MNNYVQTLRTKTSDLKQGKRLFNKQDKNFDLQMASSDFYTKLNFCNSEQVYFSFKIQELRWICLD